MCCLLNSTVRRHHLALPAAPETGMSPGPLVVSAMGTVPNTHQHTHRPPLRQCWRLWV